MLPVPPEKTIEGHARSSTSPRNDSSFGEARRFSVEIVYTLLMREIVTKAFVTKENTGNRSGGLTEFRVKSVERSYNFFDGALPRQRNMLKFR